MLYLQKRVNECKVHFRFEMYLKSVRVCQFFQFSLTHHFFSGSDEEKLFEIALNCYRPELGLMIFRPLDESTSK